MSETVNRAERTERSGLTVGIITGLGGVSLVALGFGIGLIVAGQPRPDAVMSINCDQEIAGGNRDDLSLNELAAGADDLEFVVDIIDQQQRETIHIQLGERAMIDGRVIVNGDEGRVLLSLPTASLVAGAPIPNPAHPNNYYAPTEGLTLVCHGDEPEVGPPR